ncbi:MAG: hypothetical protein QOJ11_1361 [Frankiales bacterium]|jgi:uncharacterized protein YlxW (UPF0749 family)|nr:hypothetical protein [Frankiales bacterium]
MTPQQPTARRRVGATWLVAVLCGVLGFALVTSAHTNRATTGLGAARQDDLVRILDGLTGQADRLRQQADSLNAGVNRLQSGRDAAAAALADAQRQVDALGILAGTAPAYGPGVVVTISDPGHKLRSDTLLDAVEELRDAGAEALQLGTVRVVAATAFTDSGATILAAGTAVTPPYVLTAIGDAHTLNDALRIPGGVVDTVAQAGAAATIAMPGTVSVTALRSPTASRYARPVPTTAPASAG